MVGVFYCAADLHRSGYQISLANFLAREYYTSQVPEVPEVPHVPEVPGYLKFLWQIFLPENIIQVLRNKKFLPENIRAVPSGKIFAREY